MAELKTVLGAILQNLSEARVTSDLFSRDVSLEYLDDDILRSFPVPRVDVREATIKLRFTVNEVKSSTPERNAVVKRVAAEAAPGFADEVVRLATNEYRARDEIVVAIKGRQRDLRRQLTAGLAELLADPDSVEAALGGNSAPLTKRLDEALPGRFELDPDFTKVLRPTRTDQRLGRAVAKAAAAIIPAHLDKLRAALADDKRSDVVLDVDVTRDKLEGAAETIVSEVTIVAEMRNQVWNETEEGEDGTRQNLLPE